MAPGDAVATTGEVPLAGPMTLDCVVAVWLEALEYFDGQVTPLPDVPSQSLGYSTQPTSRR